MHVLPFNDMTRYAVIAGVLGRNHEDAAENGYGRRDGGHQERILVVAIVVERVVEGDLSD